MAIRITEEWSRRQHVVDTSAQRSFVVTGVSDELAAIEALEAVGVQIDSAHPLNPLLHVKAAGLATEAISPVAWRVTAAYGVAGGFSATPNDPINKLPRFVFQPGSTSEPADRSVDGDPIVNSAFDPFDPPITIDRGMLFLTVKKNVLTFNLQQAVQYQNSINSDEIQIPRAGTIYPGQMKFLHMQPGEYDLNTRWVECAWNFELRGGSAQADSDGLYDSFKTYLMDVGKNGWYFNTTTSLLSPAPIYDASGVQVTSDVRLDGNGQPKQAGYGVWNKTTATPGALPAKVVVDRTSSTKAVYLKYRKYKPMAFLALGIF